MTNRRRVGLLVAGGLLTIVLRLADRAPTPRPPPKKEAEPPIQAAAIGWPNLPGPRPPEAAEADERGQNYSDAHLIAETRRAIRESRDLRKVEAMIESTLRHRPVDMELRELIGDIQLKRGQRHDALANYLASQTSNNDMSLTPKLIALYADLRMDEELDDFLTSSEANIRDRGTWKNRTADEIRQRRLAAASVCEAKYAEEESVAECRARLLPTDRSP